eukprot:TRINITY_DN1753_c1_g3_i1.p1 TRINITY_DN1753_c1_g3~~TRINITY_DN1753_c1_g3_i1.p1  ORF type:complete len:305 (+),score=6.99 TRINITY_DN1753_c1_g3_i1:61-975(+)
MPDCSIDRLTGDVLTYILMFCTVDQAAEIRAVSKSMLKEIEWCYLWTEMAEKRGGRGKAFLLNKSEETMRQGLLKLDAAGPHSVICTICNGSPLDGIVYSCMQCKGDAGEVIICDACEAQSELWHPSNHIFVVRTKAKWWHRKLKWSAHFSIHSDDLPREKISCDSCKKTVLETCFVHVSKTLPVSVSRLCGDCTPACSKTSRLAFKFPVPREHVAQGYHNCICDGCNERPAHGSIRYRCAWCYDYDRCEACQQIPSVVKAHDHPMMRLVHPFQRHEVHFDNSLFASGGGSFSSSSSSSSDDSD